MDKESLMRRIASATDGSHALSASGSTAATASRPTNGVPSAPMPQPVRKAAVQPAATQPAASTPAPTYDGRERRASMMPQPAPQTVQPQAAPAPAAPQPQTASPQAPAQAAQPQPASAEDGGIMSFRAKLDAAYPETEGEAAEDRGQPLGRLSSCDGVNGKFQGARETDAANISIGEMVTLEVGTSRVIGLVYHLDQEQSGAADSYMVVQIEFQGEIRMRQDGGYEFNKGIASYPALGTPAFKISNRDLATLYAAKGNRNVVVGNLSQAADISAHIDVENMLTKHFAVLGSTGCGKSSAVSLLLRATHEVVPDLRMVILDPHNEYTSAFPEANTITAEALELPFWLFQLEEYAEVLFRGKPVVAEEVEALREMIPEAKQRYRDGEERSSLRADTGNGGLTADTPVPYRISDILSIIDSEAGQLEARFPRTVLKALKARINTHCNDPRYAFMFRDRTISDKAESVIDKFFCLSGQSDTMTILQMSGLPSEVVNSLASVLCRLSFELCIAGKGKLKILMVCEEAHRYVPLDQNAGFEPTRRAIARIAKEGRKYGSFLSIISQRPAELDPTILSQCSTVFSLRLSNENDQLLIRKAISNSSKSTISFLSSLANREAIAFGEGLSTPMRLRFSMMPTHWLPGRDIDVFDPVNQVDLAQHARGIFQHWRGVAGLASAGRPVA